MFHVEHFGAIQNSRRSVSGARICRPDAEECSTWTNNLARRKSGSVQHLWPCKLRRRLRICMFHVERLALWHRVIAMACFRDFGPSREIRARRRAWLRSSNWRHRSTWNEQISQSNCFEGFVTRNAFAVLCRSEQLDGVSTIATECRRAANFMRIGLRIATACRSRLTKIPCFQVVSPTTVPFAAPASK